MSSSREDGVSIVIPCFNRAELIGEAIESALIQSMPAREVIVVDDGSTDATGTILSSFPTIRAFRTPNRGVSSARNFGIAHARYPFIKFLDSDDLMPRSAIKELVGFAGRLNQTEIAFGQAEIFGVPGKQSYEMSYGYPNAKIGKPLSRAELLAGVMPSVLPLFPVEALNSVGGFDSTLSIGEDHDLAVRVIQSGYSFIATDCLVNRVREHAGDRLSRRRTAEAHVAKLDFWKGILARVVGTSEMTENEAEGLATQIWSHGRAAARDKQQETADAFFALALSLDTKAATSQRFLIRQLYRLVGPYAAEQIVEAAKIGSRDVISGRGR